MLLSFPLDLLPVLRNAKPLASYAEFQHTFDGFDESGDTVDFTSPERGYFNDNLWSELADKGEFDQQLIAGFVLYPGADILVPGYGLSPAMRGSYHSLSLGTTRPIIAIARKNVNGQPGWYSSFAFFRQMADGRVLAPDESAIEGAGSWFHPY